MMGDFNLNAFVEDTHNTLIGGLGNPTDEWNSVTDHGVDVFCQRADLKLTDSGNKDKSDINKGITQGGKGFGPDQTCVWDDPVRQDGGRIDYILGWPNSDSSRYLLSFSRSRVVMVLMNQSKDASDHYGSYTVVKSIRERK